MPPSRYSAIATQRYLLLNTTVLAICYPLLFTIATSCSLYAFRYPHFAATLLFFLSLLAIRQRFIPLAFGHLAAEFSYQTRNAIDYSAVVTVVSSTSAKLRMAHAYACVLGAHCTSRTAKGHS
jgi:hypothetical protein